jgi:small-conductance mechanosensitive channel
MRIDELAREAGLSIAYPQRDLHLKSLRPIDVRLLPPGNGA